MTEKSSAQIQYREWEKQCEEDKRIFFWQYAKFLLSLPIPMSYELWSYLHKIIEEDCK